MHMIIYSFINYLKIYMPNFVFFLCMHELGQVSCKSCVCENESKIVAYTSMSIVVLCI